MSIWSAEPQREQSKPLRVHRGFTSNVQSSHCATTRAGQPIRCPNFAARRRGATLRKSAEIALRHNESNPTHLKFKFRAAPRRERSGSPKVCRGFTLGAPNSQRATARALAPTQSAQRVHFQCSKFAPRHSEGDLARPNGAEGSLSMFKKAHIRYSKFAPRNSESDPTRRKSAEGLLSMSEFCSAPQGSDPSKVRAATRATPPTPTSRSVLQICTVPQRGRSQRVHFRCSTCAAARVI